MNSIFDKNNAFMIYSDKDYFVKAKVKDVLANVRTPVVQRNHVERVEKHQADFLEDIVINHMVLYVMIYTGEDYKYEDGTVIKTGDAALVDGNTRAYFWQKAAKVNPEFVGLMEKEIIVGVRKINNADDIVLWYGCFDTRNQLKTNRHEQQSAAHLLGIPEEYIIANRTMLSKVIRNIKRKDYISEIEQRMAQAEVFGIKYFEKFYKLIEGVKIIGSEGAFLAAYRALYEDFPCYGKEIDEMFLEIFTGDVAEKRATKMVGKDIYRAYTEYLHDILCTKGHNGLLNPKASANKVDIVAAVIYRYLSKYFNESFNKQGMTASKAAKIGYVVGSDYVVYDSQKGQEQMMKLFQEKIVIK